MLPPIATSLDLKHTLELILDQLASVVAHQSSAILLLTHDQVELVVARGYPTLAQMQPVVYPLASSPLLDKILHNPQPVIFNGHVEDELFYHLV